MRRWSFLIALGTVTALAAPACMETSDRGALSPAAQAAVLTKTVEFAGGAVEPGDMPDPSGDTTVSDSNEVYTLSPSEPAQILALDVDHPEGDSVAATLLQFDGADDHIEVTTDTPDAGSVADGLRIPFQIDPDACEDLCNQVYEVALLEAVQLEGGEVSQRNKVAVELDCTKDGDPDKCTDEAVAAANDPTEEYIEALSAYQDAACECFQRGGAAITDCAGFLGIDGTCLARVFERHEDELRAQIACATNGIEALTECFETAECDPESGALPCGLAGSDPMAGVEECSAFPAAVQAEADACIPVLGR